MREKMEKWTDLKGFKCSCKEWLMRLTILVMEPTYLLSRDLPRQQVVKGMANVARCTAAGVSVMSPTRATRTVLPFYGR